MIHNIDHNSKNDHSNPAGGSRISLLDQQQSLKCNRCCETCCPRSGCHTRRWPPPRRARGSDDGLSHVGAAVGGVLDFLKRRIRQCQTRGTNETQSVGEVGYVDDDPEP
jgi:hypothetical protein